MKQSRKYPTWYPACKTPGCGAEAGQYCFDLRSEYEPRKLRDSVPHPGRVQAATIQVKKRGLRDRAS